MMPKMEETLRTPARDDGIATKGDSAGQSEDIPISLGVEEELFLIDPETRDLVIDPDIGIFETCEQNCGPHKVVREFIRSQIETNTRVCRSIAELRAAICDLRRIVTQAAEDHGVAAIAASTHPLARWREMEITPNERYHRFAMTFQEGVRRFIIGGTHIHIGFDDADTRIRVMTAIRRYLPLLHALSTSSPFNGGFDTGFKSYRLSLIGGLPRTGMPTPMQSWNEFESLVSAYRERCFIGDGSELWWDIRPSHHFPTIELRICDACTRVDDVVSIAALYASLVRWLVRLDRKGELPDEPLTEIIMEDRWVAQRYGVFAFFGEPNADSGRVDIQDYLAELIEKIADDSSVLGCEAEVRHTLKIVEQGASADRQLDLYRMRRLEGDSNEEALRRVVDLLQSETRDGIV